MFLTSDPDEHPSYCRCNQCDTAYRARVYELYSGMLSGGAQRHPTLLDWSRYEAFAIDSENVAHVALFDAQYFVP